MRPLSAVMFRAGESGVIDHSTVIELSPVQGRLLTEVTAKLTAVLVPTAAIDAFMREGEVGAGNVEILREKAMTGEPLFGLEFPSAVTRAMGISVQTQGGVGLLNKMPRLAHNVAVNFLRQRVYRYAELLGSTNLSITPSIISRNAVQRYDGALDPDNHINGPMAIDLSRVRIPVKGDNAGFKAQLQSENTQRSTQRFLQSAGSTPQDTGSHIVAGANGRPAAEPAGGGASTVGWFSLGNSYYADLTGVYADGSDPSGLNESSLSLVEFYNAQKADQFARIMRRIADNSDMEGEEELLRWVRGLDHQADRYPYIVAEREAVFGVAYRPATDGAGMVADVTTSKLAVELSFTVPIPRLELGGVLVIFAEVKPDEVLADVPDPDFAFPFTVENEIANDFMLDPVPVTFRQLSSTVPPNLENSVAFYTGYNGDKRNYVHYGLDYETDPTSVAARSSMWTLNIPASVTPTNILYPIDLPHYPWPDQTADIAVYRERTTATIDTGMFFGPPPIETVTSIEDYDLFGEE